MTGALGLGGAGAAVAQAQPAPFTEYHWCPGQWWDPGWGYNWDGNDCHDDHHRDNTDPMTDRGASHVRVARTHPTRQIPGQYEVTPSAA
jgi:hypothetical protein